MSDDVSNGNGVIARRPNGTFAPGQTGNPNGLHNGARLARKDVREAARALTWPALKTLQNVMENVKATHSARVAAAAAILDRGWGKPPVMEFTVAKQEYVIRWLNDGDPDPDPDSAEAEVRARHEAHLRTIEHE